MSLRSTKSCSSAKSMMRSKRRRASLGDRPSIVALIITLSRAAQVGVEADAELDERRHAPVDVDRAVVDAVDPGQALQQRRLARAVAPDDPEELARADVEGDVAQRRQRVVASPGASGCSARSLSVWTCSCGQAELLRHAVDEDCATARGSRSEGSRSTSASATVRVQAEVGSMHASRAPRRGHAAHRLDRRALRSLERQRPGRLRALPPLPVGRDAHARAARARSRQRRGLRQRDPRRRGARASRASTSTSSASRTASSTTARRTSTSASARRSRSTRSTTTPSTSSSPSRFSSTSSSRS